VSKAFPTYLGPYRLVSPVHTGTRTRIWQALHEATGQSVALKTLLDDYQNQRRYVGYLRWEYRVGQTVQSPRIIQIYQFDYDRGVPYLAMEWFAGATMRTRIRQGGEMLRALLPKIVVQATEAVAEFNARGWVHRDIKPENFLVADNGDVKLIDLALARRTRGLLARWLAPRCKPQGTKSYMAPEQIRGRPLDERADLYSLACTLYELVAGQPPFTASGVKQLLSKHLLSPPPDLRAANPHATPEFAQLIGWALAKRPAQRPRSTEQFYQRVRQTPVLCGVAPYGGP